MHADHLHVVTAIANPIRWRSRINLYRDFEAHMLDSGVHLTTIECVFGDHDPQLGVDPRVNYLRVRATGRHKCWSKECLLNLAVQRLPDHAKYIGLVDADIKFRDKHWAQAALHALQHWHVIQPWSWAYDLGPDGEHIATQQSFSSVYYNHGSQGLISPKGAYEQGHPGYAWCYTRQALEWAGGLVETAALGAGDRHMALALIGKVDSSIPAGMTPGYREPLTLWQERIYPHVQGLIGANLGTIEHHWHGSKHKRAYHNRWKILQKYGFDPETDLKRNTWGVLELAGNKPELVHDIDVYFRARNEDSNSQ